MTLVAHNAADLEPRRAGTIGEPTRVLDVAAAAGESDVDVDEENEADDVGDTDAVSSEVFGLPPPFMRACIRLALALCRVRSPFSSALSNMSSRKASTSDLLLGMGMAWIVLVSERSDITIEWRPP